MKTITTIILILTLNLTYGQDTLLFAVTTPKGINGKITVLRAIVHSGKPDFDFYRKHFHIPYHYPEKLIDYRYKNDTITVWNDPTKVGDFNSNWSYTIIYGSSSRVKSYSYSGWLFSSLSQYEYHFHYNHLEQLIKMTNNLNEDRSIEFKYDADGNIVNVKDYRRLKLIQEIELM